jgi:hypothetical protein
VASQCKILVVAKALLCHLTFLPPPSQAANLLEDFSFELLLSSHTRQSFQILENSKILPARSEAQQE